MASCSFFSHRLFRSTFVLKGPSGQSAFLYRIPDASKDDPKSFIPYKKVEVDKVVDIELGLYYLANDCSSFTFQQTQNTPTQVQVTPLYLRAGATFEPSQSLIPSVCIDPVDGQRTVSHERREFFLLPGDSFVRLAGRRISLGDIGSDSSVFLAQLQVLSYQGARDVRYFVMPKETSQVSSHGDDSVISIPMGIPIWVLPGLYTIEVNGTRQEQNLSAQAPTTIRTGNLRIDVPPHFPMQERLAKGGQPIFAYINDSVLFDLNTDYAVFPGEYSIAIEGTEVKQSFMVTSGETTLVRTLGVQISIPSCSSAAKSCKQAPKVTIHRDRKPYPLMQAEAGIPFLILEENFQFSLEGIKGIYRDLPIHLNWHEETLSRLKFTWDIRPSKTHYRTDLLRLEAQSTMNFGKTYDLLFGKPDELYVPPGQYVLSYFLGDPAQERVKTKVVLTLNSGETRNVVIPLYVPKAVTASAVVPGAEGDKLMEASVGSENVSEGSTGEALSAEGLVDAHGAKGAPSPRSLLPRQLTPLKR